MEIVTLFYSVSNIDHSTELHLCVQYKIKHYNIQEGSLLFPTDSIIHNITEVMTHLTYEVNFFITTPNVVTKREREYFTKESYIIFNSSCQQIRIYLFRPLENIPSKFASFALLNRVSAKPVKPFPGSDFLYPIATFGAAGG